MDFISIPVPLQYGVQGTGPLPGCGAVPRNEKHKIKTKNIERRTAARRANGNANHEKSRKNNGKDRCLLQRQRLRLQR